MKTHGHFYTLIALSLCLVSCKFAGNGAITAGKSSEKFPQVESASPKRAQKLPKEGALSMEQVPDPCIKFLSHGNILPSKGSMDLLFSSVSYAKAQIRVRKIFQGNILQYMQYDPYEVSYNLDRVAGKIVDTTIVLGSPQAAHLKEVKTYALSLDEMVRPEKGAVYRIEIRGRAPLREENFYDSDYNFGDYNTYADRKVDLLASNTALIAKGGDRDLDIFVMDILSGSPVGGARVKVYDYAQQEIAKGFSDNGGKVTFAGVKGARFVTSEKDGDWSYLDLKNEKALSTSNFDVDGTTSEGGIKAFIFGERGVWRPGDTLHISTIAMFDSQPLPEGHPVTAELRNPDGQVTQTMSVRSGSAPIYHFPLVTEKDAPTGRWSVTVNIGGKSFTKPLRIETVKPNNIDITLTFENKIITPDPNCCGTISANYIYGAPGSGLDLDCEMELTPAATTFAGYDGYSFKDDARSFETQTMEYGTLHTDENGICRINTGMNLNLLTVNGFLNAGFTMRAHEPSGQVSTCWTQFKMSPFERLVGVGTTMDKDEWGDNFLTHGKAHKFNVVTLTPEGKGTGVEELRADVYLVNWSWWWNSAAEKAAYMSGSSQERVFTKTFSTGNDGRGSFSYDWSDAPTGLYYIRVSDKRGGHAASLLCQVQERDESTLDSDAATRLAIKADKKSYIVGETARVLIPSAEGSRALVSIEKGGRVLRTETVRCFAGTTEIRIPVTADMLPNAYAFVTLIQPHSQTLNDAPIRLYGVQNLNVEDATSHLAPVIDIAREIKPESRVTFKVREEKGRAMSYVVALVDEGLLSLTGYKTPSAWEAFYAKEALRVRTWDRYDEIIGAYGGHIESLFAIGGDDENAGPLRKSKADRFDPVVKYLGPFELKAGRTASHTVDIPQYIGSLRAMVVATDGRAQGSTSRNVTVTKPVMVQASLPRALCIGETVQVPVTLISLKDGVGQVKLAIKTDGAFTVLGPSTLTVKSEKEGSQIEYFTIKAGDKSGVGHISVSAESSSDKSRNDVEIDVFNPNPEITRIQTVLLEAGKSSQVTAELFGVEGSSSLDVELSSIPAVNLKGRLDYLLNYPYGCIEQTVSAAFPQLYLDRLVECDASVRARSERNVKAAVNRLQSFRLSNGGMSYWPSLNDASPFGSIYALHFLVEAENCGYAVPSNLKNSLISYVSGVSQASKTDPFIRAYGLYSLALAGKPQRSAMNLMREDASKKPVNAVWMLAAAFASDGKKAVAQELTKSLPYTEDNPDNYCYYYGSEDRNKALAMTTGILTGDKTLAFKLASSLAASLSDQDHYMSTQSTAWALCAMSSYVSNMTTSGLDGTVECDGKTIRLNSSKSIARTSVPVKPADKDKTLKISNNSDGLEYATVSVTGIPAVGKEVAESHGLTLNVEYVSSKGIPVCVDSLSRGEAFKAVVTVTNTGASSVSDIALEHRFPSGWEIVNERVYKDNVTYPSGITYQDFRDDKVCSFFDLKAKESVRIVTALTASYPGKFYLPAVSAEAMYDASVSALLPGRWIEVK